jgi:hypothetical protein
MTNSFAYSPQLGPKMALPPGLFGHYHPVRLSLSLGRPVHSRRPQTDRPDDDRRHQDNDGGTIRHFANGRQHGQSARPISRPAYSPVMDLTRVKCCLAPLVAAPIAGAVAWRFPSDTCGIIWALVLGCLLVGPRLNPAVSCCLLARCWFGVMFAAFERAGAVLLAADCLALTVWFGAKFRSSAGAAFGGTFFNCLFKFAGVVLNLSI